MAASLRHRGPDDTGFWIDEAAGLALGHQRLAVIDVSSHGHQPMTSSCGRYVLVFNGEIYNHRDIRLELQGSRNGRAVSWRGHSDTETAVEAIARWGLLRALENFNGMFAIAIWDRQDRRLQLARDRIGEKPLYYGVVNGDVVFASELRAIRRHGKFAAEVDRTSLSQFLKYGYVPGPRSIYEGIYKLPPGCWVGISRSAKLGELPSPRRFWIHPSGASAPALGNPVSAVDELEALLRDAVRLRMVADVPLGAFLSGGIDSSTITALMQSQSSANIHTFSIGIEDARYDEAPYAEQIADHLKTDHRTVYVSPADILSLVPQLGYTFDEPFADPSQIPMLLLSRTTRQDVTVALSGDGGDELFCGYSRYAAVDRLWKMMRLMPQSARCYLNNIVERTPTAALDKVTIAQPIFSRFGRAGPAGDKLKKLASLLPASSPDELYDLAVSSWRASDDPVVGCLSCETSATQDTPADGASFVRRMMLTDMYRYLPDDILVKLDRSTMSVGLEGRVPLLDHRVIELALRFPQSLLRYDGRGKWPLRQVLYRYVPRTLVDRPKRGFGVPIAEWLRGPLREWAEELIEPARLREEGFLNPDRITRKWQEHISEERNWHKSLWTVLMFQSWLASTSDP